MLGLSKRKYGEAVREFAEAYGAEKRKTAIKTPHYYFSGMVAFPCGRLRFPMHW
jgi:hypothetical protein